MTVASEFVYDDASAIFSCFTTLACKSESIGLCLYVCVCVRKAKSAMCVFTQPGCLLGIITHLQPCLWLTESSWETHGRPRHCLSCLQPPNNPHYSQSSDQLPASQSTSPRDLNQVLDNRRTLICVFITIDQFWKCRWSCT